jgi:hypothetical protein
MPLWSSVCDSRYLAADQEEVLQDELRFSRVEQLRAAQKSCGHVIPQFGDEPGILFIHSWVPPRNHNVQGSLFQPEGGLERFAASLTFLHDGRSTQRFNEHGQHFLLSVRVFSAKVHRRGRHLTAQTECDQRDALGAGEAQLKTIERPGQRGSEPPTLVSQKLAAELKPTWREIRESPLPNADEFPVRGERSGVEGPTRGRISHVLTKGAYVSAKDLK